MNDVKNIMSKQQQCNVCLRESKFKVKVKNNSDYYREYIRVCARHICHSDDCNMPVRHFKSFGDEKEYENKLALGIVDDPDFYSMYCYYHACKADDCNLITTYNKNYCVIHKCGYEFCKSPHNKDSLYCENHYCHVPYCNKVRNTHRSSKFCETHRCKGASKSSYACMGGQCTEICVDGLASNSNMDACKEHQCSISGCDGKKIYKTTIQHYGATSYHPHGFSSSMVHHSIYCVKHTCFAPNNCVEKVEKEGMGCERHTCLTKECDRSWSTKTSNWETDKGTKWTRNNLVRYCQDHVCKTTKCLLELDHADSHKEHYPYYG